MPPLRDILVKQAGVLGNIEERLPAGLPRVSQVMTNVATTLPVNPTLPELPAALGIAPQSSNTLGRTPFVIKGIEEPTLSESTSEGEAIETVMASKTTSEFGKEILS